MTISSAPGRVNLLGEHTDYNDGFVLPCAVNREMTIEYDESESFELYSEFSGEKVTSEDSLAGWKSYVLGTRREISNRYRTREITGTIESTIPVGSGLSSSAALEVAVALAILRNRKRAQPMRIARICRMAEHRYAGVRCGIMDQASVMLSRKGSLFFLDCRDLSHSYVPFDASVVIVESGTKHELSASYYNERVSECKKTARALGTGSLREAWENDLGLDGLENVLKKRALHFFSEMDRVVEAVDVLKAGDLKRLGELMNLSHVSLSHSFEVSTPLIDAMQKKLSSLCYGAKLTGAGFGGSVVGVCDKDLKEAKKKEIRRAFEGFTVHFLKSSDGAWFRAQ
jgi:galactokinase